MTTGSGRPPVPLRWSALRSGDDEHGVSRYSRRLGGFLEDWGCRVQDLPVDVLRLASVVGGVRRARGSEVVHLQLTRDYWGAGARQLVNLVLVRLLLAGRVVVITAHDFHTPHRAWPRSPWGALARLRSPQGWYDLAVRWAVGTADLVLTCSEPEGERLRWARPRRLRVVPHYIEERADVHPDHAPERPSRVLLVLGFIHRRKGQHWGVRALPAIPEVELVLAGSATGRNADYLQEVMAEAEALGVTDRTRVTGYLSEEELDVELSFADVALAPYERIAASGSIATLVAGGVPLVARDDPYLRALAHACPTAVTLYEEDSPPVIAAAVRRSLDLPRQAQREELARWAHQHSPHRTAERHVEEFLAVRRTGRGRAPGEGER